MKITPITDKVNYLFPAAALLSGCAVLSACQQQQQQGGVPLPPPVPEKSAPLAATADSSVHH